MINIINYIELLNKFSEHDNVFYLMRNDTKLHKTLNNIIELIVATLKNGNKILICGNGGSAADAQHLATEFISKYKINRKPLRAEALTTDTSILTAISNDYLYDEVFSRQIIAKGDVNDLLIAFTTSGNSKNIIKACQQAKKQNMIIISIVGNFPNMEIEKYVDYLIKIPSQETGRIQEGTEFLYHTIIEYVEKEFLN